MLPLFGIISGFFALIEFIPYIRDILRGITKPQRTTWLIYSVLSIIAFFSQLDKGATNSLWLPGILFLGTLIIFLLSIKYGVGGFSKKDIFVLLISCLGLVIWFLTKEAAYALFIVILVDFFGTILTIEKAYLKPRSETLISWLLSSLSGLFAFLAVGSLNLILIIYPLFIFLIDAAVVGAILLGRRNPNLLISSR